MADLTASKPLEGAALEEAAQVADDFYNSKQTFINKPYWFKKPDCPGDMEPVVDSVLKKWRCHETDVLLTMSSVSTEVSRFAMKRLEDFTKHAQQLADSREEQANELDDSLPGLEKLFEEAKKGREEADEAAGQALREHGEAARKAMKIL